MPPRSFAITVATMFAKQVRLRPDEVAVEQAGRCWTFRELDERVNRWARLLTGHGVRRGERIGLLSENRREYLEIELAAAKLGAITACLNWRLAGEEMSHCIRLTSPRVIVASPRHAPVLEIGRASCRERV